MDRHALYSWKKDLESREDLTSLYHHKKLVVCFHDQKDSWYVSFQDGTIAVLDSVDRKADITVEANDEIINSLILGGGKLTSMPNELVSVSGSYKDLLFLESILYLSNS
ncbi:SCP2 sterol-binding domain-containing protein [Aquibacillus kalidii]|uniref:SCP2 sterol-binding domain-containing protein n=1 Tax=Aquibacillus kalidii TaxID=2762597 RepID=UPI001644D797|nr:SCP2 sterol-binding domain-containing protein [Aquibacillus kalidii]